MAVEDAKYLRAKNALEVQNMGLNALRMLAMVAFQKGEFAPETVTVNGKQVTKPVVTLAQRLKALDKLVQKGLPDLHKIDLAEEERKEDERVLSIDITEIQSPDHFQQILEQQAPTDEDE